MSDTPENEMLCGKGCHKVEIPTDDELKALNAMRDIKEKGRELKKRLSELSASGSGRNEEITHLENEMARLRKEWEMWEGKRKEAAKQRMILLGHEKPD